MNIDRKYVGLQKAEQIDRDDKHKKPIVLKQKRATRWRGSVCSICGKYEPSYISNEHAHEHGFKNANEMAQAGVVKWLE